MNTKKLVAALLITALTSSLAMPCCFTVKRIHNNTGQDAYDYKIVLDGEYTVESWESSDFREMTSGFVPSTGITTLRFWDPEFPIPHCDWVTIKYYLDRPAPNVSVACWTDENKLCIDSFGLQVGHYVVPDRIFIPRDDVVLVLENNLVSGQPVTIGNLKYTVLPEIPPEDEESFFLAQLDPNMPELESAKSLPVPEEGLILSGDSMKLTIPETLIDNQTLVYSFELVNEAGEVVAYEAGAHMFIPTDGTPTVSEWGLIIMALLLVTVGAIMIRKKRQVTA